MAAKVVALRELGSATGLLAPLVDSPVVRVRAAAIRALGVVGEYEHASWSNGSLTPTRPSA